MGEVGLKTSHYCCDFAEVKKAIPEASEQDFIDLEGEGKLKRCEEHPWAWYLPLDKLSEVLDELEAVSKS